MAKTKKTDVYAEIKKKYGKELQKASKFEGAKVEVVPSGSLGLDQALGVGGYPLGRIIEIYGPFASGKTTLTLQAIAQAQKVGKNCAFIDAECALDLDYAQDLGVKLDELAYYRPETGEEALEVMELMVRSTDFDLIVIDSVAALVPTAEVEGDMGASHVGLQARLMGQALRKLTSVAAENNTGLIFLNQLRMKIGVTWGSPETTSGGKALPFYASVRLNIKRIGSIKKGDRVIGGRSRVKVTKNKLAGTAYTEVEFDMHSNNEFGCGISLAGEVLDYAEALGIVEKSGAWYSYKGDNIGQGRDNSVATLKENPQMMKEVFTSLVSQLDVKDSLKERLLKSYGDEVAEA